MLPVLVNAPRVRSHVISGRTPAIISAPRGVIGQPGISQADVDRDYLLRSIVSAAYTRNEVVARDYLALDSVKRGYLALDLLERDYLPKAVVNSQFLPISSLPGIIDGVIAGTVTELVSHLN